MPYGSPVSNETASIYEMQIAYTPPAVDVPMTVTLNLTNVSDQGVTPAGADTAFQALLDLLDGSVDFVVVSGTAAKRYPTNVEVTPTP